MSIVSCPRCRDEVTVPAKAPPSALVRCPLCREEYRLEEALEQLPPALIVLGGGDYGDDDEGELVGAGVGDYRVAGEMGGYGGGYNAGMSDSAFSTGGPGGTALADSAVAAPSPRVSGAPRPKRKQKSAVAEIIKVVLGGVVGIAAALGILWWGFGVDALGIGPSVAEYAPWIVPAQFHGKAKSPDKPGGNTTAATSGGNTIASNNQASRAPANDSSGANDYAGGFAGQNGADLEAELRKFNEKNANANKGRNSSAPPADPGEVGLDPSAADVAPSGADLTIDNPLGTGGNFGLGADMTEEEPPAANRTPLNPLDNPPDLSPATDTPDLSDPSTLPSQPPTPMPSSPATTESTDDEATVAPGEVEQGIAAATRAREAFDNSKGQPREVRQQMAIEMYEAAASLGPMLAQAPTENADFAAAMEKATEELTALADPSKRTTIAFLATKRLDTPDEGPGIVLVGTVRDFKSVGSMYEMTVELAGKDPRPVAVVLETNPQDQFKAGDLAAVVGRLVRDVKKDLPKYGGEQTQVVEFGHAIGVTTPE